MSDEPLDVMAPIAFPNGKTVWVKVGVYWPSQRRSEYLGTVSLTSLPIGATAPLELYLYPQRKDAQKAQGQRSARKGYRGSPPEEPDDVTDPRDLESPGDKPF